MVSPHDYSAYYTNNPMKRSYLLPFHHNKGWWRDSGRYSLSGAAPTAPTHFRIPHIPLVSVHSSSGQLHVVALPTRKWASSRP
jgi:hypothetical protein